MPHRRQIFALLFFAALAGPGDALAGEAVATKKKGGGLSYLQLETLTATVMRATGRRGVLTVEAGVDIPESGLRARATLAQPRLRAAYVERLQIYAAGLADGAPPDPDYVARILQQETDRVLGQPGAKFLVGTILVN